MPLLGQTNGPTVPPVQWSKEGSGQVKDNDGENEFTVWKCVMAAIHHRASLSVVMLGFSGPRCISGTFTVTAVFSFFLECFRCHHGAVMYVVLNINAAAPLQNTLVCAFSGDECVFCPEMSVKNTAMTLIACEQRKTENTAPPAKKQL